MTGRTHDLAAVAALSLVVLAQPVRTLTLGTAIMAVGANLLGGIAPDIDQPTAPLWRNVPVGKYFGKLFGLLNGGHRFLTHSLLGVVLFGLGARALLTWLHPIMPSINIGLVWWAFMIGVVSHLVMDSFTKEGVPWLLPIPVKWGFPPLKKLRLTTGTWGENLVIFPLLAVAMLYLAATHQAKLFHILQAVTR